MQPKILSRKQIEELLSIPEALQAIKTGFVAYSNKETIIPPVGSLHFENPSGECHIKYGYSKSNPYYVVKIASGFPNNPKLGLPSGNGLMLLFDKQNGQLLSILLDDGFLTDIRTAGAGCIAAEYLAPANVTCVGIVGTGAQAYYQLKLLTFATPCRKVLVWGRDPAKVAKFKKNPDLKDWEIESARDLDHLANSCNLIVTTTSSSKPLLFANQIQPGTHITAVGADDVGKQELDPMLFKKADRIIVDSRSQCEQFGDTSYALKAGYITSKELIELGDIIMDVSKWRTSENQITIADLTGVAIQDLQIATAIFEASIS